MMRKLFNSIVTSIKCFRTGHISFNGSEGKVLRLIQPHGVGNGTREIHVCERCNTFYVVVGELSAEELQAEAAYIQQQTAAQAEILQKTEEYIKRLTEVSIEKNGKSALN